jgi:hypothetical protein
MRIAAVKAALVKHAKYARYILRHKWFVLVECWRLGILWRGIVHDLSKFAPSEWLDYAQYFYGDNSEEGLNAIGTFGLAELAPFGYYAKDRLNVAWLLHQKRNRHHWQFWVLQEDSGQLIAVPMPDKYRREMLADWKGAGRALGKPDTRAWYEANKHKMLLHSQTRDWIEKRLGIRGHDDGCRLKRFSPSTLWSSGVYLGCSCGKEDA